MIKPVLLTEDELQLVARLGESTGRMALTADDNGNRAAAEMFGRWCHLMHEIYERAGGDAAAAGDAVQPKAH
jgi:hypothetical protein